MTLRLPDELRTVVIAHPGVPLELLDEQTHTAYVLLPAEEFPANEGRQRRRAGRNLRCPDGIGYAGRLGRSSHGRVQRLRRTSGTAMNWGRQSGDTNRISKRG